MLKLSTSLTILTPHSGVRWSWSQVVLTQLQHLGRQPLLGQREAAGGSVHQDPGGGDGGREEGGGEALQTAPPRASAGPGPRGGRERDQAEHVHTGSHQVI